jgi:hypothetical protein
VKLCVRVNELLDEPRAGHSVYLDVLSSDPFHFTPPPPSTASLLQRKTT